jgi:hypothetical protein
MGLLLFFGIRHVGLMCATASPIMNRVVLFFCSGLAAVAVAMAGCSAKDDSAAGDEQDICESKPDSEGCAPTTKKKDAGTKGSTGGSTTPTPPPTPPPAPSTTDAGEAGTQSDAGTPIPHPTVPRDVCVDMANIVAMNLQQKCRALFADEFQAFVNAAAGGDCRNIKNVRDINALYGDCVPWIQRAQCTQLRDTSAFPDSCKGQLLP